MAFETTLVRGGSGTVHLNHKDRVISIESNAALNVLLRKESKGALTIAKRG